MTIAVDFDGVIHAYSRGWADGTIYDPPLPGALDGLRTLMARDAVFIFTTRDIEQVAQWLSSRGFLCLIGSDGPFWNERGRLLVTNRKLAATAYLDDRAVRFNDWEQALAALDEHPEPDAPEAARIRARIRVHASLPEPAQRAALRKAVGLTQQELAEAIGVDKTAVAHWEAGRRNPNGINLDAYLKALNLFEEAP